MDMNVDQKAAARLVECYMIDVRLIRSADTLGPCHVTS